eukprot:jgi/Undpi1/2507/HiC_scaffold_13.g05886.m1
MDSNLLQLTCWLFRNLRGASDHSNGRYLGGSSGGGGGGSNFSWDEEVLEKALKDMLVERAVLAIKHFWSETGGDLYEQWLDRFDQKQNLGDATIKTMGWDCYLLKMMKEEPVEAVVVRTARKDSEEVVEAQRKNSARPPTLDRWRHTANQLAADWDAEDEEEMKVALDYPPQLQAVTKGVVIQPAEMAKKIMDIREQLVSEWREDLANIETENEELLRVDADRANLGDERAERGRKLTYDHGASFGGSSSPFRAENYDALLDYVTEIGALAVQEKLRVKGDKMGWDWMEQFLFWTKANSQTGSVGLENAGPAPISPSASSQGGGGGGDGGGRGARGKEVGGVFGTPTGGMQEGEGDDGVTMRGNNIVEEMLMGQKVQMFDPDTNELVGVDPAEISRDVMAARLGVAERIRSALETVPEDHGLVLRKYLEETWMPNLGDEGEGEGGE